jgi:hypothetical protein
LLAALVLLTWQHITLGEAASDLRPLLGDPLRVLSFNNGTRHVARYWLAGSNSTYVLVVEERGYVVSFDAFTDTAPAGILENVPADPFGVRLGDTLENVKVKHPTVEGGVDEEGNPFLVGRTSATTGVEYSFENNRVRAFQWAAPVPIGNAALAPLAVASGDATSSAILDVQQDETDGVAWEYRYLAFHPCTENARWQLKSQSLLNEGGRAYDKLRVVCPPTKSERDFYFDITNYYGKL